MSQKADNRFIEKINSPKILSGATIKSRCSNAYYEKKKSNQNSPKKSKRNKMTKEIQQVLEEMSPIIAEIHQKVRTDCFRDLEKPPKKVTCMKYSEYWLSDKDLFFDCSFS
ncbi:hypothetical protein M9Y10_019042 [Tritrichomonas musculus]|uniref:Uncharacterized protein n=1 Tax=Tritrichomonas musculus TaxID=1915356 RepID=A0ABR2HIJ9_9EUKA